MTHLVSPSPAHAVATAASTRPAVELEGVCRRFGAVMAVDHLDLCIHEGEFFSFLGPSGCGKTTTLRLIAGFDMPSSGRILLQGNEIHNQPAYRRNVNTVFQSYALFPHLDVYENIAFGLRRKGVSEHEIAEKTAWSLHLVALSGFERRRPQELSGGEQQRVAMARALVNTPSVLLLDEPLSALDERLRKRMQGELKRIQRETGITFVLVTHDQEEALTLSDRIAVMNKGRFEQVGTPTEIYERPRTRFVTEFVGDSNLLGGTVAGHRGDLLEVAVEALGTVAVPVENVHSTGTTVELFIRPEKMRLASAPPARGDNGVQGTLQSVHYQGPQTRCEVTLANGRTVTVTVMNLDAPLPYAVGDPLWVHWPPASGRLLAPA